MNFRILFSSPSSKSSKKKWGVRLALLAAFSAITVGVVISQTITLPPLVVLPAEPLYMNGAKTKGNLTLALSVEFPTVGQTYRDDFDSTKEYVGYFDPKACYRAVLSSGSLGNYFDWQTNKGTFSATCPSSQFDGNFMNWATSSAIDIMRYGLTGGNRTIDDSNTTVVDRAWLPDNFYKNSSYFSEKFVPNAQLSGRTENSPTSFPNGMWIYNCKNRVYFADAQDSGTSCDSPFGVSGAQSEHLIKANANNKGNFYEVRNLVCDPNSATNRLMTYDPDTKKWTGLCYRYPNGKYKPVGQFQMNADNLRVSVLGYLQDDNRSRYGGVLRAPLKYLGPKNYDTNFNLLTAANARSEWDATTGVFVANPQSGDSTYGDQGFGQSGVINYVNKFGTLNPDSIGEYKTYDPLSELYYEAIRYLQGKQPTAQAITNVSGSTSSKALQENFPVYKTWTDPFAGFTDTTDTGKGCLRNSILTIADVFTHSDRSLPGNTLGTSTDDFVRSVETNPALDVPFWTSVVGSFESKTTSTATVTYSDSQGLTQTAGNLATNKLYDASTSYDLSNAATVSTGAGTGSYYMAGLAYWANTQSFRTDLPKGRIKTYSIDVNENRASDNVDFRRTRQLYLGAKYGGFDDSATGNTGNPYTGGTNVLWQGTDGEAKNYFLVSDAKKFLDSLAEVFARVVEETGSIAGGAISTQRLTAGQAEAVFQARFNPVANFWSGRLIKFPLTLDTAGTGLVIGNTPTWEAGQVLTAATLVDHGAARNIVIGAPIGLQATVLPTPFKWADLAQAHKDALNISPYGVPAPVVDTLGPDRLNYLRGDRSKEITPSTPLGPFRPRDIVMGDIVNSGLVYMGKPSGSITGTDYNTFYAANKSRSPVIFANANDGMLHAFYDSTGAEAFAYIPGFVAGKLNQLPDQDYSHISINDATPAVSEAYIGGQWRSVLVSGVGGGGQGLYALDVTNPATFTKDNVLWEFTDRDHVAMGNVLGTPQIVKLRTTNNGVTPVGYKWYAVVASGINNYAADGYAHATGNPSIFIIDLSRKPSDYPTEKPWTEGTNFWRIELPQSSTTIAKGLLGLTTVKNFQTGAVDSLYAGDMQGNVWKLDFTLRGTGSLTTDATTNLTAFNAKTGTSTAFFVAKDSNGALQPITGEPVVINAFFDSKLVSFGTGKYLETPDTTVPMTVGASFYTLLDNTQAVTGRSVLQQGSVSTTGTVTIPSFVYGKPTTAAPALRMGWYIDFDKSIGERQISDITADFGQLFFGSLFPTKGSCGEGGGRFYAVNSLTGNGMSELSQVGILAAPLVLEVGSTGLTLSDTSGQRTATRNVAIITQGSKGLKVAATGLTYKDQVGRLSWRQINNFRENKNN
ncbi:putative type-4 fimbrial biogenesis pily1-related signal peptide protein [Rhodoferax ferrireducens T118]|uniref:Putative type-4 fimbrial biogenesis pily1-related signal peptide protein n=1 Tax=Albidiferax ferrireducens (strain ATCC BAA-621 / DSM 15236 / T118) TaxID=338969 RepID=Q21V24_ALBFT|nr:PilC/PilY family type IV pilus protein [Rhodoferax ferrireducens]ABD70379.1 putative type-4 fimbrial biogenesis pily1-related signal peptide protein [Rhodoferax ferrireducens T118]